MTTTIRYIVRRVDDPGPDPLSGPHFGVHASDGHSVAPASAWAVRERDAQLIAAALTALGNQLKAAVPAISRAVGRAQDARAPQHPPESGRG